MSFNNLLKNWTGALIGVGLIALGICSFLYPDALEGVGVRGRRALIKAAIVWCWGWPLGIGATLFGALVCVGSAMPEDEDEAT